MGVDEQWITKPVPEKEKEALAHSLNDMCYHFYNRAWDHQQAEIDRLKETLGLYKEAVADKSTASKMKSEAFEQLKREHRAELDRLKERIREGVELVSTLSYFCKKPCTCALCVWLKRNKE